MTDGDFIAIMVAIAISVLAAFGFFTRKKK
ncbi:LPXTG cell wall anchor domain-containing protein [Litoreibacter roseus]|nr:LPXTG cell wall anchor domain-containing protein [Litoreibacter roseus]